MTGGAYMVAGGVTTTYGNINLPLTGSLVFSEEGF
jgi:hypothetical protein